MDSQLIANGISSLVDGIRNNTWPEAFFTDILGLDGKAADSVPQIMLVYLILYFAAAVVAVILHFVKKVKSFSNFSRKFADMVLTVLSIVGIRIVVITLQIGRQLSSEVSGSFSFSDAGITWLSDMVHAWFGPIGTCLIVIVTMLLPVSTMLRYLKEYKLCGLPWAIYDVGFGLCCVSAIGLSMANGDRMWYAAVPAALVLVMVGQTGGSDVV